MSHIYWELKEIPIPEGAHINHHDGRVFLMYILDGKLCRQVIGRATSETTMHPNECFRLLYPALWNEYYGDKLKVPPHVINVGMYAVTLCYGESCGLYQNIIDAFGPQSANAIMDYCMFSIQEHTNSAEQFEEFIKHQLCFSRTTWSDSWFSELMSKNITEDQIHTFKKYWLQSCIKNGHDKVWLCIDGSNNDCFAEKCDLAELGYDKKGLGNPIVSYIWAVSAKNGLPITWFVNNGGMVDQKALNEIVQFLCNSGFNVEGVILDRGFCSREVVELLKKSNLNYVIMLKSSTYAFKQMMEKHAEEIRHNPKYIINRRGVFGITDKVPLFANSEEDTCVGLYFDWPNAAGRGVTHICKVLDYVNSLKDKISNGKYVEVSNEFTKYVEVSTNKNNQQEINFKYENWQKEINSKGYSAIASSEQVSAQQLDQYYDLRDISEKRYSSLKSHIGYDVTRAHKNEGIQSRFACSFIASIIRSRILISCRNNNISTNRMLISLQRCNIILLPNGRYSFIDNISKKQMSIFEDFGLKKEHFNYLALHANNRIENKVISQVRTLVNVEIAKKRGPGRPPKPKTEIETNKPKRRPGRPLGSKNKKTLEREAAEANQPLKEKRRPGRPLGSKNKKTIEREAALQAIQAAEPNKAAEPKRGPGRPKGSKNKTKQEREALALAKKAQTKRPGRPKGSRNKKTLEREAEEAQQHQPKQGPGRLRGGKNKKTIEREVKKQQQERRKMRLAKKRSESEAQDGAIVKNE